jgi:hypothetical protein
MASLFKCFLLMKLHKPAMQHAVNMMMVVQVYDVVISHLRPLSNELNRELQNLFSLNEFSE